MGADASGTASKLATVLCVLRVTPDVRDAMFVHALSQAPLEACGMISTHRDLALVDYFHPMRNAAKSATLFELDGQEMLDLERGIDETNRSLIGVMHSHTTTSAYPSPTDVRDAANFDPMGTFHHLIVSLRHPEPALRCYLISGETITEVPVVVTDGDDDDGQSGDGAVAAQAAVMPFPRTE